MQLSLIANHNGILILTESIEENSTILEISFVKSGSLNIFVMILLHA